MTAWQAIVRLPMVRSSNVEQGHNSDDGSRNDHCEDGDRHSRATTGLIWANVHSHLSHKMCTRSRIENDK
jgi:hypothetical protein